MPPRSRSKESSSRRRLRLLAIAFSLVAGTGIGVLRLAPGAPQSPTDLHYTLAIDDPAAGVVTVALQVPSPGRRFRLGFSGNALSPTAPASKFRVRSMRTAAGELAVDRSDQGWTVRTDGDALTVEYEVHLRDPRGHGAFTEEGLSAIDADGARLLGSDVFLFPVAQDVDTIEVDYALPAGWDLHHPFSVDDRRAAPPDLRALYSSVVAVGAFRHAQRRVGDVQVQVALRGRHAFGDDDLLGVIERIVAHQLDFFGDAPYDRYLFVVDEHPHGDDPANLHYFGLHFDASMLVLIDPRTDRRRLQAEPASLCAHEFFHNWLGERLRQNDYAMNWFVEGITTLYAYRTRLAIDMLDHGRYAEEIATRHREHWIDHPLRHQISLAHAGSIVLQDPAITRMTYTGGLLVGIALDDAIVSSTQGAASLDDVLRRMVERAGIDPHYRLTRQSLETELERTTGEDFGPWLERYVYGREELPLPGFVTGR